MSFKKRRIDVTFNLGKGQFGNDRGSDVTLRGYRTQVSIAGYTGDVQSKLQLRIDGLTQDMANQLTSIGPIYEERRNNQVLIAAGDAQDDALTVAYQGTIEQAWAEYNHAPDITLNVIASAGAIEAVRPVRARSYRGAIKASTVISDIASSIGLVLENNGVSAVLSNPYFPGTAIEQLRACAKAGHFHYTIDRGVIAIWPYRHYRFMAGKTLVIEPGKNLIGYPSFTGAGVEFTVLYTPELGLGQVVKVVSVIDAAQGDWSIVNLTHQLESEKPGGLWKSVIRCLRAST